jgi:quinol monooxygenase YgiN
MIIRIVKLSFRSEEIENFLTIFHESKELIRATNGCLRLELLQKVDQSNVLSTYSWWETEQDLENYRHSELFKTTWAKTKPLFNSKPQAWSFNQLAKLD